ncbi:8-amino-7-oxononanoate synthase [Exilibacterium tricleocarpae]|uniref:8-amino-7-oxononanoate synthase n=1 Tax=Exilibacterium tricleocarpae TaxID=2591008 RepID=A0A545T3U6_9GAMM|nr:8-amino-7-oxononanoate synthase [Exilibacterium tricleocarpae]TQV71865.1 8-amino-7-oxononanoate synthase [Exilibacterium tricleocarpae]
MEQALAPALAQRSEDHLYRHRRVLATAPGRRVTDAGGRCFTAFCSNDYLGLAKHPKVVAAFKRAAERYGVGSGASHLVSGHGREHRALEDELADFTGRARALLFCSGYMANLGTVKALVGKGDAVFEDRLNHASLLDAGLSSGARFQRFRHLDSSDLQRRLLATEARRRLIAVDGVFSMDGDIAPLPELVTLAQQHGAWLLVDDAHGFGCLGPSGGGVAEHFALAEPALPILIGTLGKAFGTAGAFVAGSEALIETLIQQARTYIYTTALPPALAAATRASLQVLRAEPWRRQWLAALIQRFRRGASTLGLSLADSATPIQPVILGDSQRTLQLAAYLEARGFLVGAIRPPTVPAGSARLRITLSAAHTEADVDGLLAALADAGGYRP